MTVHRLLHGEPAKGRPIPGRIRAAPAKQLLAVTGATVQDAAARRDAAGTRRRLQALSHGHTGDLPAGLAYREVAEAW
jgi:hypothetical protein